MLGQQLYTDALFTYIGKYSQYLPVVCHTRLKKVGKEITDLFYSTLTD